MNIKETMEYIAQISKTGSSFGLAGIKALLAELGEPQKTLKVIHIAGTNGKGSVSSMLESVFCEHGYRTGRFSSPAVFEYEETFRLSGRNISGEELAEVFTRVRQACDRMMAKGMEHPTIFEAETAAAYLWFAQMQCDLVIMEAGLGGIEDATNVIEEPLCSVVTSISMDHRAVLGDTLEEIAENKAGILKQGRPAVIAIEPECVSRVLKEEAEKTGSRAVFTPKDKLSGITMNLQGITCEAKGWGSISLQLTGEAQKENLALVLTLLEVLEENGIALDKEKCKKGLAAAVWKGRFEVISREPYVILDGAHNPDAAEKLGRTISSILKGKRIIFIAGVLKDKEYDKVMGQVLPLGERVYTVTPPGSRGLLAEELAEEAAKTLKYVQACKTVEEAVQEAYKYADKEDVILAFGSLSYLSQVREAVKKKNGIC